MFSFAVSADESDDQFNDEKQFLIAQSECCCALWLTEQLNG